MEKMIKAETIVCYINNVYHLTLYVEALEPMQFNNENDKRYYQNDARRKKKDHCVWYLIKTIVHL